MKIHQPIYRSFHLLASLALGIGIAHAAPLSIVAEADLELFENLDTQDPPVAQDAAGPFDSPVLNARFSQLDRNEIIALRFDLSAYERSEIAAATLRLIAYRNNTSNQTLRLYGVVDGATGLNSSVVPATEGTATDDNWPESGTVFSTMPGLEYDADVTTRGLRGDQTIDLGTGVVSSTTLEGAPVLISTPALRDFLVAHEDDVVTILVTSATVTGNQKQFASREATLLANGVTPQPAGTYAPRLIIDLPGIRIPAVADTQVNEQGNFPNGGSSGGANPEINIRWIPNSPAPAGNNEIVALRFDLTGYNPSDIISADVRLTNQRLNNTSNSLHYYGVVDNSTGFNELTGVDGTATDDDWVENGTNFANMPGLIYNGDTTSPGINPARTVDLGSTPTSAALNNLAAGSKVIFSSENLISFLKNHPDNLVTILVVDESSGTEGQKRFTSKEATTYTGGPTEPAGTFAPEINLLVSGVDRDEDGLLNSFEEQYGLNPDDPDTDGNGILDGDEDSDEDFSNNLAEQTRGTFPDNPDSDFDGILDGYETKTGFWAGTTDTGTNPLAADTDADGLPDGLENPELAYTGPEQPGTDPNIRDTDGDLYSDGAEIARNSDPTINGDVPDDAPLEVLGTGSTALLPSPLTDPDNNIDDSTPAGANFNWAAVTTTSKPFFGTGVQAVDPQNVSGAFDLFDNKVGVLNDKWLAGGVNAVGGAHTTVEFPGTVSLTSFTIASADDRPERDPVDWQILGSNDGVVFTKIFEQFDAARATIWTARNQVVQGTLAAPSPQYRYIRFACTLVGTGENQVHVNEIQYFGTLTAQPVAPDFRITGFTGAPGPGNISLTWLSQPGDSYRITYSTSLTDGFTSIAASGISAEAGSTTTHSFANPLPSEPRLFFRVEKP